MEMDNKSVLQLQEKQIEVDDYGPAETEMSIN